MSLCPSVCPSRLISRMICKNYAARVGIEKDVDVHPNICRITDTELWHIGFFKSQ